MNDHNLISNTGRSPKELQKKSNLIPNSERSPEELREMGRKGGIVSGKARREKRDLQKMAKLFFEVYDGLTEEEKEKADQNLSGWVKEILNRG